MLISREVRTANKVHTCSLCRRTIRPGDKYSRYFGRAETTDPMEWVKECKACRDPEKPFPDGYDILRQRLGLHLFVGQRIVIHGKPGTLVEIKDGLKSQLYVLFDGDKHPSWEHPTHQTVYYAEDGETILADYRVKKQEEAAS